MSRRNFDFSNATKRLIAERAGLRCSNPVCNRCTSLPQAAPTKSTSVGKAAHIESGGKGPRANPHRSLSYLKSHENGIWLCSVCHDVVDSDTSTYTVAQLRLWKSDIESRAILHEWKTLPPLLAMQCHDAGYLEPRLGRSLPRNPPWKHYSLNFRNPSRDIYRNVVCLLTFPENTYREAMIEHPVGTGVRFRPDEGKGMLLQGDVTIQEGNVDFQFVLEIDSLSPGQELELNLAGAAMTQGERLRRELANMMWRPDGKGQIEKTAIKFIHHAHTTLQFDRNGSLATYTALHLLEWDFAKRSGYFRLATYADWPFIGSTRRLM